jgi:hypothetical protein
MKRKHTLYNRLIWIVAGCSLVLSACTKNFESINTDPYGLSEKDLKGDFALYGTPFNQIQLNIHQYAPDWQYQRVQNLNVDIWSGYMMTPINFAGNVNNITYAMVDDWNNFIWQTAYANVMAPVQAVIDRAKKDNYPNFEAWGLMLKVMAMHRTTDLFGPIVYSNFGKINPDGSVTYDSQQEVYNAFFKDLDDAQAKLKPYVEDAAAPKIFTRFDLVYAGDYAKWMKFLNSLRLRLAMRIVKVDGAKARLEAEKALASPFGVIETNAEDFIIDSKTITNPLNTIANSWQNIRMGAPMESFLDGYNDPRLQVYFQPATDKDFVGQYRGIRPGINLTDATTYANFSSLGNLGTKMPMLTAAETWFLRAEAKLRGWTVPGVNTVQEAYEKGIELSFSQWGIAPALFTTYKNSTATPKPYVDPKNAANNIPAASPLLSKATPKWNEAGSFDEKMEQIITQKYLAVYPESCEAYAEFRRTGYPKLWPNKVNHSAGVIPEGEFIKRINFVISERESNGKGVQDAITKLGGQDNINTPVWWDKP